MSRPSADDEALVSRLSLSVTRLARVLRQQESTSLTPALAATLAIVVRDGPISLSDLAAVERVSPSTMTRLVRGLEERGLVERVIDPADRRVHHIKMAKQARKAIESYRSKRNAWLLEQLDLFSAAERQRLAAAVEVLEGLAASAGPDPVIASDA
jgi:DNA-binding MarR family transcriptional regulator